MLRMKAISSYCALLRWCSLQFSIARYWSLFSMFSNSSFFLFLLSLTRFLFASSFSSSVTFSFVRGRLLGMYGCCCWSGWFDGGGWCLGFVVGGCFGWRRMRRRSVRGGDGLRRDLGSGRWNPLFYRNMFLLFRSGRLIVDLVTIPPLVTSEVGRDVVCGEEQIE